MLWSRHLLANQIDAHMVKICPPLNESESRSLRLQESVTEIGVSPFKVTANVCF
jgi:hypothetical protein